MAKRRRTGWSAWFRDGWGLASLAICLVLVSGMLVLSPQDQADEQFLVSAEPGEWVDLRNYRARLESAQAARAVVEPGDDPVFAHPGTLFVVARWSVAGREKDVAFSTIQADCDGARYAQRSEFSRTAYRAVAPGFTETATAVFELPTDCVSGAQMVLGPPPSSLVVASRVVAFRLAEAADAEPVELLTLAEVQIEVSR